MVIEATDGPVTLGVGDELVIRLPENPTTGYVWQASSLPPVLESLPRSAPGAEPAGGIGAGRDHVFRYRAIAPGSGVLRLRLGRAWEPDPVEQRELSVQVVPPP